MRGQFKQMTADQLKTLNNGKPVWITPAVPGPKGEMTILRDTGAPKHYSISPITCKGLGMFASKNLASGARIASEFPLGAVNNLRHLFDKKPFEAEKWLKKTIGGLEMEQRTAIEELQDMHNVPSLRYFGLVQTNAFSVPDFGFVLLKDLSRINHSCRPNCEWIWDHHAHQMHIAAVKPIKEGEEVTIHYGKADGTRFQRQMNFKRRYKFECTCDGCSLKADELTQSDSRRMEIEKLLRVMDGTKTALGYRPVPDLGVFRRLLNLLKAEGIAGSQVADVWDFAAKVALGDVARGSIMLQRAVKIRSKIRGEQVNVKPADVEGYCTSDIWSSTEQDKPEGDVFGACLWNPPAVAWCSPPTERAKRDMSITGIMTDAEKGLSRLIHHCQLNDVDPDTFFAKAGDSAEAKASKEAELMKFDKI